MKNRKRRIDPMVLTLERECERYLRAMSIIGERDRALVLENKRLRQLIRMLLHSRTIPFSKKGTS